VRPQGCGAIDFQFRPQSVHLSSGKTSLVQFDELQTFEHTRLKPVSVGAKTSEIIDHRNVDMSSSALFKLNHLFAKIRQDLSRLFRSTWATTKRLEGLYNHLMLYVAWINGYEIA